MEARSDLSQDNAFKYGPNPETMAHILEDSEFSLQITASQRLLIVPLEDRVSSAEPGLDCQLFCQGIPPEIFEDELIQLFNYDTEVYEFRLIMDPATEMSRGIVFITFVQKEHAERMQQKLNDFEIRPGKKLKVDFCTPELKKFFVEGKPLEENEDEIGTESSKLPAGFQYDKITIHICTRSSQSNYCICITEMLKEIKSLWEKIREKEQIADQKRMDEAQETNKTEYASHSLLMEDIEANADNLEKIYSASDYAIGTMNNVSLTSIVEIHNRICPELKSKVEKKGKHEKSEVEQAMFRQEDVLINGIYRIPVYPSGVEFVPKEMKVFVEHLKETLANDDIERRIIMAATVKWEFLLTHPFVDGNGRCSRVIFNAILRQKNFPWIAISIQDSTKYYEALKMAHETEGEDLTLLYRFLCGCVRKSVLMYLENLQ